MHVFFGGFNSRQVCSGFKWKGMYFIAFFVKGLALSGNWVYVVNFAFCSADKNPGASKREELGKKVGLSEMQVRLWLNKKRFEDGKEKKNRRKRSTGIDMGTVTGPVGKKPRKSVVASSCDHLAFVASDLTGIPNPDTPCKRFIFYFLLFLPASKYCCFYYAVITFPKLA